MVGLTGSWPGIGHVHQWSCGLGQRLVVDRVGHCGGFLLVGLPEVIVGQQHSGPVIWGMDKWAQDNWVSMLRRIEMVSLTDGLHGVPLLDEQLSSGDVDVHP